MSLPIKTPKTIHCRIDLDTCQLTLCQQSGEQEQTHVFELPARHKVEHPVLRMRKQGLAALNPENTDVRMLPWHVDQRDYGLSLKDDSFLYEKPSGAPPPYLFETRDFIFPGAYTKRPAQGPYDLFVSANLRWLAVVARVEAVVLLFDVEEATEIARHHFEMFEGEKVICVALDPERECAYLTSADARKVWSWNINTTEVRPLEGPWKYPTHIQCDPPYLWVLDSHKTSGLYRWHLETQACVETPLKGSGYAHLSDSPTDLLGISRQGRLAVLTHEPLPDPLTPLLHLIDTQDLHILAQLQPAKRTWPALLVTAHINPEYQALMQRHRAIVAEHLPTTTIDVLMTDFGLQQHPFKSKLFIQDTTASTPIDMPTLTRNVIFKRIQTQLEEEHGVKISFPPQHPETKEIMVHAEQLTQLLHTHERLAVLLYHLMGQCTLAFTLHRSDVFASLKLTGSDMGFEFEPLQHETAIESQSFSASLPTGHFSLADPLNHRLLQLNSSSQPVFELDSSGLGIYRPVDFTWYREYFMVLDAESGEATCWDLSGHQQWCMSSAISTWNKMKPFNPSSLLILGLDTTLGILEAVDVNSVLRWKIEADVIDCAAGRHIWVLHPNGLLKQLDAEGRSLNTYRFTGQPTVVAVSEESVAVFDSATRRIEWQHIETLERRGFTLAVLSPRYQIQDPRAMKWVGTHLVIYDAFRLLSIDTLTQTVISSALLQDLKINSVKENQVPTRLLEACAVQNPRLHGGLQHSLIDMLKKVPLFSQAPDVFFDEIAEHIRTRVYNRGEKIVNKGDLGQEMYLIRQGEVEVIGARLTEVVAHMNAGDIFGEVALMTGQKRNATLIAKTYCELFCLAQADLDQLMLHYPEIRERLIQLAQDRGMQEQLRSSSERERLKERLAALHTQQRTTPKRLMPSESKAESPSRFTVWARFTPGAQLQQLTSTGEVLQVVGNNRDWVQPAQAVVSEGILWVLDTGQNQLFKSCGGTLEPVTGLPLAQGRDLALGKDGSLWVANTGKGELLQLSTAGEVLQQMPCGRAPASVDCLGDDLLSADLREHTVTRRNRSGEVIWRFGTPAKFGRDENHLFSPEYAQFLSNGNILITDTGNSRVLEVNTHKQIVWALLSGENLRITRPTRALRLSSGNTLIEHSGRSQWTEVSPDLRPVWRYQVKEK